MKKTDFSVGNILGLSFAVLFFWIFAFNIWFSNNILDRDNFVDNTTKALTSETTRNVIAGEVVEATQDSFPVIGTFSAPLVEKVVVGLLDTELFSKIFASLSEEIYYQLTSTNPEPLEINIGQIVSLIQPFLNEEDQELVSNIPETITIIGEGDIPNISGFANTLAILGPVSLIIGLVLVGIMWKRIVDTRNYFVMVGLISAASGFLVFSIIPVFGNYLTSGIASSSASYIVSELYKAFTGNLTGLSLAVLLIGLFTALVAKYANNSAIKLPKMSNKSK